jgi:peptidoglycan/LPS O-acetylase OafA/YrhL
MIKNDINGVMWSMTVECYATPLIFWSDWIARKGRFDLLWIVIVVLFGLSFVGPYIHLLGGFTNLAPLYAFVVGVILHHRGRDLVARLAPASAAILTAAAFALFTFCALRKQNSILVMLETASASGLIMMIAFREQMRVFRLLDLSLVRFYGRISYSFYLLHVIGIAAAMRIIDSGTLGSLTGIIVIGLISIGITTAMAWPSWRFIEKPFIALGRRFDGRKAAPAAPVALQAEEAL